MSHRRVRCLCSVITKVARRPNIGKQGETSRWTPEAQVNCHRGALQHMSALGRFGVGESHCLICPSWGRENSPGHHPVSFVGSRVPRTYPLRQGTGAVIGPASQPLLPGVSAFSLLPPNRRKRSADKYPRSTSFALHSET
jgi:hypothetical protein